MSSSLLARVVAVLIAAGILWCQATLAQPVEISVSKTRFFVQTNSTMPVLDSDGPYVFVAVAYSEDFLFILNTITVTPPGRPAVALQLASDFSFRYDAAFSTKAELDSAFPSGEYRAVIEDLFGSSTTLTIDLTGDHYPPAPWITNFTEAQAIGAASDFDVAWPPLTGATLSDTVGLLVVEGVIGQQQVVMQTTQAATPLTTSARIPASTLQTGAVYFAAVDFGRLSAYHIYPSGDTIGSLFGSITQLPLRAPIEPYLRGVTGTPLQFRFNSIPNRDYEVQSSADLIHWDFVETVFASPTGYTDYYDFGSGDDRRFLRVQLLPP